MSCPDVAKALEAAGALRLNPLEGAPDELTGGARPGDDDFASLTGRRPVVEAAWRRPRVETPG